MARWAIYDSTTGRMVSETSVQPTGLRAGLASTGIPDNDAGLMWSEATRAMVTRPPKVLVGTARDRFATFQADARFTALNATQRTRIMELVTAVFGHVRFD